MKPCVMQLLVTLKPGGAERLALDLLVAGEGRFRGLLAGLFHEPGELAAQAREKGIPCLALCAEKAGRLGAVLGLYRALRREKVTVLHAQAGYLLQYALPAAKAAGVPLVYTEHALHSLRTMPRLRFFVKLAAPMTRAVTAVSREVADYLTAELGLAPARVRVIPNGVDLGVFSPRGNKTALPWSGEGLTVFGTVARLTEAKDHATLLRALALLRRERPGARLLLVGDGETRPQLERLMKELGVEDIVSLAGMRSDIAEHLRAMDIFVLSSRREGFPMAVLEAMACGLPVVSTAVGGIPGLNAGGDHICLVPPENPEALAASMAALMDDGPGARARGERGKTLAANEYSGRSMAERYFRLYHETGGLS